MKRILGIQKDHNSSACLFYDDELIYYNQEERLSRIKKDSGLPIETLKKICEISSEIDVLVISGYDNFHAENHSIMSIIQKLGFKFSQTFEFVPYYKSHHLMHAAKAFYSSGFDDALIFVQDGRGSYYNLNNGGIAFESTSVFSANSSDKFELIYRRFFTHSKIDEFTKVIWNNNFTLDKVDKPSYFNRNTKIEIRNDFDIGFMYEGTSRGIGFDDDGGKMMGLQSYGAIDESLPAVLTDDLKFNMDVFNFDQYNKVVGLNYFKYINLTSVKDKTNFAFMVQQAFQKIGLKLIKDMIEQTNHKNIILTGGTALNVIANNYYRQQLDKSINMYIEPICGDEGNCIGICQYYYNTKYKPAIKNQLTSIYICGNEPTYSFDLKENETEIVGNELIVSELLRAGHIVSLFQGKGEAGPRALGNRSLLYDPRVVDGKRIVNTVKRREEFRPFAAAVMLDHADEWFDLDKIENSPFMMYAVKVREEKKDLIPAVIHVDNSCRIQTVTDIENKNLYNIIKCFYDKTGIPMLLNTSFNLAGDPIVETVEDALESLRNSDIQYLYLPDIKKLIYIPNITPS
jgi:carbamoyltransferase